MKTQPTFSADSHPLYWRVIACDLDGTLIGKGNQALPADMEAIHRAKAAGLHVAICTGRNPLECRTIVSDLDLSGPGVYANGAFISEMSTGRTTIAEPFPIDLIDGVVDFFTSCGHATLALAEDLTERLPQYWMTTHAPPHRATREWQLHHKTHSTMVDSFPHAMRPGMVRMSVVVNVPEAQHIIDGLNQRFGNRLMHYSIYSVYFDCQVIEVFMANVSKWTGLTRLAAAMNLPPSAIITIGDDVNDIQMLQGAQLSFAMGNAHDHVKASAKRITKSQPENGVAAVIDGVLSGQF